MPSILIYIRFPSFFTWHDCLWPAQNMYYLEMSEHMTNEIPTLITRGICTSLTRQRLSWVRYEQNWCSTTSHPLSLALTFIQQPVPYRIGQLCAAGTWKFINHIPSLRVSFSLLYMHLSLFSEASLKLHCLFLSMITLLELSHEQPGSEELMPTEPTLTYGDQK